MYVMLQWNTARTKHFSIGLKGANLPISYYFFFHALFFFYPAIDNANLFEWRVLNRESVIVIK